MHHVSTKRPHFSCPRGAPGGFECELESEKHSQPPELAGDDALRRLWLGAREGEDRDGFVGFVRLRWVRSSERFGLPE